MALPPVEHITVNIRSNVATVILDRPDKRNALSLSMWKNLGAIFQALGADDEVRAIILTGAARNFCAGADISEFAKVRSTVAQTCEYEIAVDTCCEAIATVPKPAIAAIAGFCMGGGCNIAMSCDFRFAHTSAVFGIPAARLSIVYGISGTQRLLALVGLADAKRILYSAQRFDAHEALRIGFADCLCDDPLSRAREYCTVLADNAPLTISGTKTMLNKLASGTGPLAAETVQGIMERAIQSGDYREGRLAFAEKRRPVFQGR